MRDDAKFTVRLCSPSTLNPVFAFWNEKLSEKLPCKLVEIRCQGLDCFIYVTVDGVIHKVCDGFCEQPQNSRIRECIRFGFDTHTGITYDQLRKVFQSLKIPFESTSIELMVHML